MIEFLPSRAPVKLNIRTPGLIHQLFENDILCLRAESSSGGKIYYIKRIKTTSINRIGRSIQTRYMIWYGKEQYFLQKGMNPVCADYTDESTIVKKLKEYGLYRLYHSSEHIESLGKYFA